MEVRMALRTHEQAFLNMFQQFRALSGLYPNILAGLELSQNQGWNANSLEFLWPQEVLLESRQHRAETRAPL